MYLWIYYNGGISLSSSQLYWHILLNTVPTFTISQPNGIVSTDYKKYMKHRTFLTAQNEIRINTFSSRLKHEESLTRDHQEVSYIHRWYGGMEALMTLSNLSIAASRFLFLLFALPTKPLLGSICFYKLGQILSWALNLVKGFKGAWQTCNLMKVLEQVPGRKLLLCYTAAVCLYIRASW